MFDNSFLDQREKVRVRARAFVGIAYVDMRDRGSGFERFVGRLDLFTWRNRDGQRIGLARDCACYGDSDDGRRCHAVSQTVSTRWKERMSRRWEISLSKVTSG